MQYLSRLAVWLMVGAALSPLAGAQLVEGKEPNRGGTVYLDAQDPEIAKSRLHVPDGFKIELFATEKDFPIYNPVSLTFDGKGRLWVATMPSYPQRLPDEAPNDTIVILEDTNNDGKADDHTVFIDGLHVPTGFELGDGGVYIAQQPNLIFARDLDGDDVADTRETILHGFGTEDSHHSISAFTWGPGGGLYFQEGTFHHSQVETPYGPVRLVDAGVFRYKPDQFRLDVFVSYPFANPWGHIFDRWGQNFIADASGGSNYFGSAISGNIEYPNKRSRMNVFTTVVRPTAGCEIVSSRHFPDAYQGNFIVNNTIGFQGIKNHKRIEIDSGFESEEQEPLLWSEDINFRPVDLQFGPDGALYIVDWFNPMIGHMQYSLRDEGRDNSHGRIWRITYTGKPLLKPVDLTALPTPKLLDQLKEYEDRTRYRTRAELRARDRDEVITALDTWVDGLRHTDSEYHHHMLEALWVYQGHSTYNIDHLLEVANSPEPRSRAAAMRVLRYWRDRVPEAFSMLKKAVNDPHPRVRLEAILTLSFFMQPEAAELALEARGHEMDYYLDYVLNEAITTLLPAWRPAMAAGALNLPSIPGTEDYLVARVDTDDLATFNGTPAVYKELIGRGDADLETRAKAVAGLAALSGLSEVDVLLATIESEDAPRESRTLGALSEILLRKAPFELRRAADGAKRLAAEGKNGITRQTGYAMLVRGQRDTVEAWQIASAQTTGMIDFIRALPMAKDSQAIQSAYDYILPVLVDGDDAGSIDGVRRVRIELPGERRILTVAEVEVMSGGQNVALGARAKQSSTAHGGVASRATDGNTNPHYSAGGQTHTNNGPNPWIEIDLGEAYTVDEVRVWHRTGDGADAAQRLDGFTIKWISESNVVLFERQNIPSDEQTIRVSPLESVRRVAMEHMYLFEGHDTEIATTLAKYIERDMLVAPATRALNALPVEALPVDNAAALADKVVAHIDTIDMARLSSDDAQQAFTLGARFAGLMADGSAIQAQLDERNITVVELRPVPHRMVYDKNSFDVRAGSVVEIVFENVDIMPHNVVITAPGALGKVGGLSETLSTDPAFIARQYVPDTPEVLFATRLIQPGRSASLVFRAPAEVGEYPFVCTFPGHWLTMRGVMNVVDSLESDVMMAEAGSEDAPKAQREFVADWKLEDILPGIASVESGRNFELGKSLFTEIGCNACHVVQGEGLAIGPDLTNIGEKYSAADLVTHIMDPSREVADEYKSYVVETVDFDSYSGFLVKEDEDEVHLRTSIVDPTVVTVIRKFDIDSMDASKLSAMPQGLTMTMQLEEIYELVAYLLAGGDPNSEIYK